MVNLFLPILGGILMSYVKSCLLLSVCTHALAQQAEVLIRDTSWSAAIRYNPAAMYQYVRLDESSKSESLNKDKVPVLETEHSKNTLLGFLMSYGVIPESWDILPGAKQLYHYDPLDALTIAMLDGNVEIAVASLQKLPLSKAVVDGGRVGDYRKKEVEAKPIDVDHFLALALDTLDNRLTRTRAVKTLMSASALALPLAGAYFSFDGQKTIGKFAESVNEFVTIPVAITMASGAKDKAARSMFSRNSLIAGGAFVLLAWRVNKKQEAAVKVYLDLIDLLAHDSKLTFTRSVLVKRLGQLQKTLTRYGCGSAHAKRIQAMIASL